MPSENILNDIGANEADPAELEQLLLSYFHRSTQPTNDRVQYGDGDQHALELRYSAAGNPSALIPGPAFRPEDRAELRRLIQEQLLTPGPIKIGRAVMFSGVPTTGYYRFRDEFQILPVPPEAPRPEYLVGDHPFILEVSFSSSDNPGISMLRRGKQEREIELLCSLLLSPGIRGQSRYATSHWVYEPLVEGNLVSTFRQAGYSWVGARFQEDAFSAVEGLAALVEVEPQEYYTRRGVGVGQTLEIPSTFSESLDTFRSLSERNQERFMRASYWYQQSFKTWLISHSISFEALVSAIEALMPPPAAGERCPTCQRTHGPGPTQNFIDFVDRLAPELSREDRRRFYSLRSAISHGGKLLHADKMSWGVGLQQANEDQDLRSLSAVVRAVLINWLHTPPPR